MKRSLRLLAVTLFVLIVGAGSNLYFSKNYYPDHPVPGLTKAQLLSAVQKDGGDLIKLIESDGVEWYGTVIEILL